MHVLAVPLFDATGVAVALTLGPAIAACSYIYFRAQASKARALLFSKGLLGPKPVGAGPYWFPKDYYRAQASKAQGPIDFLRIIRAQASKAQGPLVLLRIIILFFFFFFLSTVQGFLGALTCSKTLENSHTRWNPRPSGRRRGWDPGVAQGLYGAP